MPRTRIQWIFVGKGKNRLQCIIRSAEKVIGNLPSPQDLHSSGALRRARRIVADPSHPGNRFFETLPSGSLCCSWDRSLDPTPLILTLTLVLLHSTTTVLESLQNLYSFSNFNNLLYFIYFVIPCTALLS